MVTNETLVLASTTTLVAELFSGEFLPRVNRQVKLVDEFIMSTGATREAIYQLAMKKVEEGFKAEAALDYAMKQLRRKGAKL